MTEIARDSRFDVIVAAGPRVRAWPTPGARAIAAVCAELGLGTALVGGDEVVARGLVPLPGAGGILIAEDGQKRIHRMQARAFVRIWSPPPLYGPFDGWISPGHLPVSTARALLGKLAWPAGAMILGSGNRALHFGGDLLESGARPVTCVEPGGPWGSKRFAGWEVERRRFEGLGGECVAARPLSLVSLSSQRWEVRLADSRGVRIVETSRLISAGPFAPEPDSREWPHGSALFELAQTAGETLAEDVEGWVLEEERGRLLACRIARALIADLGSRKEAVETLIRRSRKRIREAQAHRDAPFAPGYDGKWLDRSARESVTGFRGVPRSAHRLRPVASIECLEDIPCKICETVCPERAIGEGRTLVESDCTACGICLHACPSSSIAIIHEPETGPARVVIRAGGMERARPGQLTELANRRGEALGGGRILAVREAPSGLSGRLLEIELPSHLAWEARFPRLSVASEDDSRPSAHLQGEFVELTLGRERRLLPRARSLASALFSIGWARAGDALDCRDGSCGRCALLIDGVRRLACQTPVRAGMSIEIEEPVSSRAPEPGDLCPCLGITAEQVSDAIRGGRLRSPESVIAHTRVGEGRCQGALCAGPFARLLSASGIDVSGWLDWRFPWVDWKVRA